MLHEGTDDISGLLTNTLVLGGQEAPLFSGVILGLFLGVGLLA